MQLQPQIRRVLHGCLDFFVRYTQHAFALFFYTRKYMLSLRRRSYKWGKNIFENQYAEALLFNPIQISPNRHGYSKIVEIDLETTEATRRKRHTVENCSQLKLYLHVIQFFIRK